VSSPGELGSEPYHPDNLLDRATRRSTRERFYAHCLAREAELLSRAGGPTDGEVLSVGCGWHPGRHLFPAPQFRLTGVDLDPARVAGVLACNRADKALVAPAGKLPFAPKSFDVVLYRLVLHHLAYRGSLRPYFAEAASLLRPGGLLVAIEPGSRHPVGAALALANRVGLAEAIHGTRDDIPVSPRTLTAEATDAGLTPRLMAVTYSWRRLPPSLQRGAERLDRFGSHPAAAQWGHTLMLVARR
jgi:SAM-dependent methyltransferase